MAKKWPRGIWEFRTKGAIDLRPVQQGHRQFSHERI